MNVLSLFDGMSCGRIALDRAGIKVGKYYASEIDKYATKVSEANYPDIIRLGDVTKWQEWDIDWSSIDLLIGGSPCQDVSFAGKGAGLSEGTRSSLLYCFVEIMNHIRNVNSEILVMLENVTMSKENEIEFNRVMECEPLLIKSQVHTAVDRVRNYWCNFPVSIPECIDIEFGDVRDWGVSKEDGMYYSEKAFNWICNHARRKGKNFKVYTHSGKFQMLEASMYKKYSSQRFFGVVDHFGIRYPTVSECEKLHGVPVGYCSSASDTQAYQMLGNGWQVDTVTHIFNCIQKT